MRRRSYDDWKTTEPDTEEPPDDDLLDPDLLHDEIKNGDREPPWWWHAPMTTEVNR